MKKIFNWALNLTLSRERKLSIENGVEQGIERAVAEECEEMCPHTFKRITVTVEDYNGKKFVIGSTEDATIELLSIDDIEAFQG